MVTCHASIEGRFGTSSRTSPAETCSPVTSDTHPTCDGNWQMPNALCDIEHTASFYKKQEIPGVACNAMRYRYEKTAVNRLQSKVHVSGNLSAALASAMGFRM